MVLTFRTGQGVDEPVVGRNSFYCKTSETKKTLLTQPLNEMPIPCTNWQKTPSIFPGGMPPLFPRTAADTDPVADAADARHSSPAAGPAPGPSRVDPPGPAITFTDNALSSSFSGASPAMPSAHVVPASPVWPASTVGVGGSTSTHPAALAAAVAAAAVPPEVALWAYFDQLEHF